MKVAHLATSLHGGAGIAAFRIHESLIQSGIESRIYTLSGPKELQSDKTIIFLNRNIAERNLSKALTVLQARGIQGTPNLFTPFSLHTSLINQISGYGLDVIHLHNIYNLTNWNHLPSLLGNSHLVLTLHDMRNFTAGCHYSGECKNFISKSCQNCPQTKSIFKGIVKRKYMNDVHSVNQINKVALVAPSEWIMQSAQNSPMWGNKNFELIRNPIPEESRSLASRTSSDRITIGFVSPILNNPFKGFHMLIEALTKMPEAWWQNKEVLLVGDGAVPSLAPFSRVSKVSTRSFKEMDEIYDSLDFLIIPSLQDNFPNIVGESTMRGTNLIVSDAGGLKEVAEMFSFARFESGNSIQLANCLQDLRMLDRMLIARKAREIFSYEKAAKAYVNLYSNLSAIS